MPEETTTPPEIVDVEIAPADEPDTL